VEVLPVVTDSAQWVSIVSALFGAWLVASAFVFDLVGATYWNGIVVGAAVVLLAGYSAYRSRVTGTGNAWSSGLAALLGLWAMAAPVVYEAATTTTWSSVASGAAIAVLSGYEAYEARKATGASGAESPGV
jgi:4-hydroxybenzoate polyprenyltransferase